MFATVRHYENIDQSRKAEVTKKVNETLMPRFSKLPGFSEYYLIESGNGVLTSFGLFETSAQADESARLVANWMREEKLETALPNSPKITDGEIMIHKTNLVAA